MPPPLFRALLANMGRNFYAQESNLNLMAKRDLSLTAMAAGIEDFAVQTVLLGLWPSNLLLIGFKPLAPPATEVPVTA